MFKLLSLLFRVDSTDEDGHTITHHFHSKEIGESHAEYERSVGKDVKTTDLGKDSTNSKLEDTI